MPKDLDQRARELYVEANSYAGLFTKWEYCSVATKDIWYRVARHVQSLLIDRAIETHKEYRNETLTCNCKNHSNRRIAQLQKEKELL